MYCHVCVLLCVQKIR
ncbi:hypothetical protein KUCAC02_013249 [Chaenocephalus aceratus]|nr:hypothetical protein KUCAC02_013249 [Chaenocephalus aceratus]